MNPMSEHLDQEDFATADELMAALSPANKRWLPDPSVWCFRGQDRSADPLIPSSFRAGAWKDFEAYADEHGEQWCESMNVLEFQKAADHAGFEIPGDSPYLREQGFSLAYTVGAAYPINEWPPNEALGIAALARHYGVPTRLLDWSWKPRVAAYFACVDLARESAGRSRRARYDDHERFAVWALNTKFFEWLTTSGFEDARPEVWIERRKRFTLVTAPYASNPNLAAQAGVFTLDRQPSKDSGLDEMIGPIARELFANANVRRGGSSSSRADPRVPVFYKFTVPHLQSVQLLRLLAYEGVTAAMVFPGLAGVVQALRDRRIWERDGVIGNPSG